MGLSKVHDAQLHRLDSKSAEVALEVLQCFQLEGTFRRSAFVVSAALLSSSSPRGELAAPPALPSPELDRESYLGWLKVLVSVLILS